MEQKICQSKSLILSFFSKGSIASDDAGGSQGCVISCAVIARSTLPIQADSNPTPRSIVMFGLHLIAGAACSPG